jgi:PEP-CTERM motif
MLDRIVMTALILVAATAPALAGNVVRLPEPTTVTLFGLGIGGAYLAKRLISRK